METTKLFYTREIKTKLANILVLLSAFAIGLGCLRIGIAGNFKGLFLVWNLFLAWIPFLISFLLVHPKNRLGALFMVPFLGLWLLFLPNAPYLITDLIHLRPRDGVPLWYDATILFVFAFLGLLLGIVSSLFVHEIMEKYIGPFKAWLFLSTCFTLSGYGIYLGRFLRWNSWDLLVNPIELLRDSFFRLTNPIAIAVTGIFALFLFFSYLIFYQLIHLKYDSHDTKNG